MTTRPIDLDIGALLAHGEFLRRIARGLLHDEQAAEDVVQETYLAALERRPAGRDLRAWLATVARRISISALRGRGRRKRREDVHARRRETVGAPAGEAVARLEVQRRVVDELRALDEKDQTVILLRYFEDLDLASIGERLGVSKATARSRLRRALARLRERLDRRHGGDRTAWTVALLPLLGGDGRPVPRPGKLLAAVALVLVAGAVIAVLFPGDPLGLGVASTPGADPSRGGDDPTGRVDDRERTPPGRIASGKSFASDVDAVSAAGSGESAAGESAPGMGKTWELRIRVVTGPDLDPVPEAEVLVSRDRGENVPTPMCRRRAGRDGALVVAIPDEIEEVQVQARARPDLVGDGVRGRRLDALADGCEEVRITLAPGARVRGRVLRPDGSSAEGAEVHVWSLAWAGDEHNGRSFEVEAWAGGAFGAGPLALHATLIARSPGFAQSELIVLHLGPGERVRDRIVRLRPAGVIEGEVLDPTGRPIEGVTVSIFLRCGASLTAATGLDGRFRHEAVPLADVRSCGAYREDLGVTHGRPGPDGRLVFRYEHLNRGVRGRLLTATGKPISGEPLLLRDPSQPRDGSCLGSDDTDPEGRFCISGAAIPAGRLRLESTTDLVVATDVILAPDEGVRNLGDLAAVPHGLLRFEVTNRAEMPSNIETVVLRFANGAEHRLPRQNTIRVPVAALPVRAHLIWDDDAASAVATTERMAQARPTTVSLRADWSSIRTLEGTVKDAETGEPIPGVLLNWSYRRDLPGGGTDHTGWGCGTPFATPGGRLRLALPRGEIVRLRLGASGYEFADVDPAMLDGSCDVRLTRR